MDFHVSLIGRQHLSREIYAQLRGAIVAGRLRPRDALPPTREMASRLGVARATVTAAYDRLAGEGFITSHVGSGTFVCEHAARLPLTLKEQRTEGALRPRRLWKSIPLSTAFARPAAFDFRSGLPDVSLFPHQAWRRLMTRELRSEAAAAGVYAQPAGHQSLREAIARHIGVARGVACSADDVTVTNGVQQAMDVLGRAFLAPGDRVAVEDPGYPPPRWLLQSLGARVMGVPVDDEGLVVDALPRGTRLVYVTPSHQYPLGMSMALGRRLALLAWAEKHNAAIVEDDYDCEFRFGGRPIEPLQMLDATGRVIYVGSFSKTMFPTLRLGFVVTPPSLREAVLKAKFVSDWHSPMLLQAALARFINDGAFARHIRKMGNVYRVRHELITSTLSRDFGDYLELIPSSAGLHIAAVARRASPKQINGIVRRASEDGIEVQTLAHFAIDRRPLAGLLLGYGALPTSRIEEGLRRLRACFDG
jgi:GntR family transcriptional regulator / MocR family aminotransferase